MWAWGLVSMMLGKRLLHLLDLHEMKQVDLANQMHLSKTTISQYINGDRMPDAATLSKLADTFGVTIDYLLGRTDDPHFEDEMPEDARVLFRHFGKLSPEDRRQVINLIKWLHAKIDSELDSQK